MKKEIPWSSIVGFLLLLALGIGIPFWLEYKSLTNPPQPSARAQKPSARPTIDARKGYYCGNCGGNISLPEWSESQERGGELASPLSLNSLGRSNWGTLRMSTHTATRSGAELRENP